MAKEAMKGRFITFEGSEGSGKSTHSKLLYDYLKSKGLNVIYIREPGGTKISEAIRGLLLDCKNDAMSREAEMLLYMAARAQLISQIIQPALKKGQIVLCDRFLDSTLAYQGYGLGIDLKLIRDVGKFATRNLVPGLTIFLDLPAQVGLKACAKIKIKDRIEKRPLRFHLAVRSGYLKIARQESERFKIVKVENDKAMTQSKVRSFVGKFLSSYAI
ncbi:MAG: dTMP kinase [Candidatus Omnitrophica bacterium]|nr:dTMP kinase [Candidatus Omnitrophota bacterium]